MTQPSFITALCDPNLYDNPVGGVELIETHISWVILAGDYAYKIKKPVNFGFLDFSTLAQRRFFCDEELRLNRRFAPEIYLSVVAITGTPAAPRWGGEGEPFEYAVKMRRFAQESRLDHMLVERQLREGHIDQLAVVVADFHRHAPLVSLGSEHGTPDAVQTAALDNCRHIRPLLNEADDLAQLTNLEDWTQRNGLQRAENFAARRANGFVRECHGDLHLQNIAWLDDRAVLFDCIEFNPNFRWIDVMSEVAFLTMDLADRGRADLARRFLNEYLQITGDFAGLSVLRFYQVYRAMVRAKVACLRMAQHATETAACVQDRAEYRSYVQLAVQYAQTPSRSLLLTSGFSGSGKTTVARQLCATADLILLRSDVERKRLYGYDVVARNGGTIDAGIYSAAATQKTYQQLGQLAQTILAAGWSVVVDATFLRREQRESFYRLAEQLSVPLHLLYCHAPPAVLRERIKARQAGHRDASEADLAVLAQQLNKRDEFDVREQRFVVDIDTTAVFDVNSVIAKLSCCR